MKLYATIASERASKGQGGNKFLDIEIRCGSASDSQLLASLTVRPLGHEGDGYGVYDSNDSLLFRSDGKDKCAHCGEELYGKIRVHHHTEMIDGVEKDVTTKGEKQKGDYGLEPCKKHKDFVSECLGCNENNSY